MAMTTQTASDLGKPISEEIKYAWLDEDGNQMSPTHEKLRSALNFINGWNARWARVQGQVSWEKDVTRTGKPPHRLQRLIVRTYSAELTAAQQEIVETYLEDIKDETER